MNERFYSCTLLSDVVINASLSTEGNMASLDYIPGSSLLGIVANGIYSLNDDRLAFEILHSGKVSFGDARIAIDSRPSYALPFQFFTDKVNKDLIKDAVYLAHYIAEQKEVRDAGGNKIQPQQVRNGYFVSDDTSAKFVATIPKKFSLKSAHDRDKRTSKDGQMFGMEAMQAGLRFIFSIRSEEESHLDTIEKLIKGTKRLGKSKSAQYGRVDIQSLEGNFGPKTKSLVAGAVLIYAESHLCFYDEQVMPTYQPTVEQLGLVEGNICWEKSQVRTFDYANWNTKRQTTNPMRYCIARGSVLYVENSTSEQASSSVGTWQSEGLGRVLYNPSFLSADANSARSSFNFIKVEAEESAENKKTDEVLTSSSSALLNWLQTKYQQKAEILNLSREVHLASQEAKKSKIFEKVSSSQWGKIREFATYAKSKEDLAVQLLNDPKKKAAETDGQWKARKGYLMHGVAYDGIWNKNRGRPVKRLMEIFAIEMISQTEERCAFRCQKSLDFIAKFAAEMAKIKIREQYGKP